MNRIPTECISWRWNGNLGDDLIWAAQEEMFGQYLRLDQWIKSPEAILIGGGTWIPTTPIIPSLPSLSKQTPTVIFGTGADDFEFSGTEAINDWIQIIHNSRYIGLRGPLSVEKMLNYGFPEDKLSWIGDPALFYSKKRENIPKNRGRIGINVGTAFDKLNGADEEAFVSRMIQAINLLNRNQWEVSLFSVWEPDDQVIQKIASNTTIKNILYWHSDYNKALNEIDQFDLVICEKLHASIVAACRAVPFVALAYRNKVTDFCHSINWEKFSISTENLDPYNILEIVDMIADSISDYSLFLEKQASTVRSRLMSAVPLVLNSIKDDQFYKASTGNFT